MADNKPTPLILRKVSAKVTSLFLCKELAKALSVDHSLVKSLSKKHRGVLSKIAFGVLQFWLDENDDSATSQLLYQTLKESRKKSVQSLARRSRFLLVKKGKASMHSYVHNDYIHTCTYIQQSIVHTYTHGYHTYIHSYIHIYIHAYIHTCIHTYMHTYIHT